MSETNSRFRSDPSRRLGVGTDGMPSAWVKNRELISDTFLTASGGINQVSKRSYVMIRRDDGNDWLIISQIDHAQLAADLAAGWIHSNAPMLPATDLLVQAVREHDEGWRQWEAAPTVDPATGKPRNFTEMPMAVSTRIWSRSIEFCRRDDALPGIWVSRHFCWLAQHALSSRKDDPADVAACRQFLAEQSKLQQHFRSNVQQLFTAHEIDTLSTFGFWFLKFFDSLSLWLCCASRTKATTFTFSGGNTVRFLPRSTTEIAVEPYPLSELPFEAGVRVQRIPAKRYTDGRLQAVLGAAAYQRLDWTLVAH